MTLKITRDSVLLPFGLTLLLALAPSLGHATAMPASPGPDGNGECGDSNGPICVGADSACQFTNLQDAIDSASENDGAETTIHIANNLDHENQRLFVFNRNLTLRGGYSSCSDASPSGRTTLHGVATGSVISIGADAGRRTIKLEHLEIRGGGGNDPFGFHTFSLGGGVSIGGDVAVTISASEISHNRATFGGGIAVGGEDGAELTLIDTLIADNSAANGVNGAAHSSGRGGGIYCLNEGNHVIDITMDGGQILGNVAVADSNDTTHGGGVYLEGCSFNGTASGTGTGVVLNIATGEGGKGGGFYLASGSGLQLHGTGAGPFPLSANVAGGDGGGIYAQSSVGLDGSAVDNNTAGFSGPGNGGGVYLANTSIYLFSDACVGCSTLNGNSATGAGAAIYGHANAQQFVDIESTTVSRNSGSDSMPVIELGDAPASSHVVALRFFNALVVDNAGSSLIKLRRSASQVSIGSTTIANNDVDALITQFGEPGPIEDIELALDDSIVLQPSGVPLTTQTNIVTNCVMVSANSGLPADPDVVVDAPLFVDAETGDFHLQPTSSAIDFCAQPDRGAFVDLDGNPRGVDAPQTPPFQPGATYDLGAYEWQPEITDRIFADGFD